MKPTRPEEKKDGKGDNSDGRVTFGGEPPAGPQWDEETRERVRRAAEEAVKRSAGRDDERKEPA